MNTVPEDYICAVCRQPEGNWYTITKHQIERLPRYAWLQLEASGKTEQAVICAACVHEHENSFYDERGVLIKP